MNSIRPQKHQKEKNLGVPHKFCNEFTTHVVFPGGVG